MSNLDGLREQIAAQLKDRSRNFFQATLFVKFIFIVVGTLVVGVAQFFQGSSSQLWQTIGILGTVVVALGGVFMLLTDRDASAALESARKALDAAKAHETEQQLSQQFEAEMAGEIERAVQLYTAMVVMRGAIERTITATVGDEIETVSGLLVYSRRPLLLALGFDMDDHWTICIYKAAEDVVTKKTQLHCIAHERSIPCDVGEARSWPECVGVGGLSYGQRREIIVPDMTAPELGNLFDLGSLTRSYNLERYRSIVAVPVRVGAETIPWGIVVATSDRAEHFHTDQRTGVRSAEAIRALGSMVSLAVAACRLVKTNFWRSG
jgi:hypothetical protein